MQAWSVNFAPMGGLWVDYPLMSNLEGLFVLGEANFSDHGANRLGASALMQGLAAGYFVAPSTMGNYLAEASLDDVDLDHPAFAEAEEGVQERIETLLSINGERTVDDFHRDLGIVMWDKCGMARTDKGLKQALKEIAGIRAEFWENVNVTGSEGSFNQVLERAGRVADFLEFSETMVTDALVRSESCGGHFREESQTPDGEAMRDDKNFSFTSAWEFTGVGKKPTLHKEKLEFNEVKLTQRSYK